MAPNAPIITAISENILRMSISCLLFSKLIVFASSRVRAVAPNTLAIPSISSLINSGSIFVLKEISFEI